MPRSFNWKRLSPSALGLSFRSAKWSEPQFFMRLVVGALIFANLLAGAFAFHLFGRSPADVDQELAATRMSIIQQSNHLKLTRQISSKVVKARAEGDLFLVNYMTPRRTTYSTIVGELQQAAEQASLTWKEGTIAPLEPIKGSEDISMMTVTVAFEGTYPNLLKFTNLLDKSPRFLVMESLAASPQPGGKSLSATVKVNTFVRGDTEGAL